MKRLRIKSEVVDLINLFGFVVLEGKDTQTLEELFAFLRTNIKYTLLDLEATRRERDAPKK